MSDAYFFTRSYVCFLNFFSIQIMDKEQSKMLMWVFTLILVVGFILTYRNLNGTYFNSNYEGLILSVVGLLGSVYIGVKSSRGGTESLAALYI